MLSIPHEEQPQPQELFPAFSFLTKFVIISANTTDKAVAMIIVGYI